MELIRQKDGSIVSIRKISEVISVQLFITDAVKLAQKRRLPGDE